MWGKFSKIMKEQVIIGNKNHQKLLEEAKNNIGVSCDSTEWDVVKVLKSDGGILFRKTKPFGETIFYTEDGLKNMLD